MSGKFMMNGIEYLGGGSGGGGASALADLTDVNLTDIQDGQIIKWDDATQKFVNADESGGGGGGSATISEESLYVATSSATGTYALLKSIDNFDFIAIWYGDWNERTSWGNYVLYSVASLNANHNAGLKISVIGYSTRYTIIDIYGTTLVVQTVSGQAILEVRGIKIKSIGGISDKLVTLDNELRTTVGSSFPLSDNIEKYDLLIILTQWRGGEGYPWTGSFILPTSAITYDVGIWIDGGANDRHCEIKFTDATHYSILVAKTSNDAIHGIYGVKLGSGANSQHTYSITEQVVGTWIDGKPIYETTYNLSSSISLSTSYSHSGIVISNIEKIVSIPSAIDANGQSIPLVVGLYSNNELAVAFAGGPNNGLKSFTLQYTKTTD